MTDAGAGGGDDLTALGAVPTTTVPRPFASPVPDVGAPCTSASRPFPFAAPDSTAGAGAAGPPRGAGSATPTMPGARYPSADPSARAEIGASATEPYARETAELVDPVATAAVTGAGARNASAEFAAAQALDTITARLRSGSLRLPATTPIADTSTALAALKAVVAALAAERATADAAGSDDE